MQARIIVATPEDCAIAMLSLAQRSEAARAGQHAADILELTQRRIETLLRDGAPAASWSLNIVARLLRASAAMDAWEPLATASLARMLSCMLAERAHRALGAAELTDVAMSAHALARRVAAAYGPAPPFWESAAGAAPLVAARHPRWGWSADVAGAEGGDKVSAYTPARAPAPHPQVLRRDAAEAEAALAERAALEATLALPEAPPPPARAAEAGGTVFAAAGGGGGGAGDPDGAEMFLRVAEGGGAPAVTPAAAASEADLRARVRSTLADVTDAVDVRAAVADALSAVSAAPATLAALPAAATAAAAARSAYGAVPRGLAAWATGAPFVAVLSASRGEEAGASAGRLLADLAHAARPLSPPFRAAAAAFTAAHAAAVTLGTLERLAFGLSRCTLPRPEDEPPALESAVSALQRELLVRCALRSSGGTQPCPSAITVVTPVVHSIGHL